MDENDRASDGFTRRDVLQVAGSAAVLSTAALLGLSKALAQQRATGNPLLNEANINALLGGNRALLTEMAADPRAFLANHFSLTPSQQASVAAFTPQEVAAVQSAVRSALASNLSVKMKCASPVRAAPDEALVAQTSRMSIVSRGPVAADAVSGSRSTAVRPAASQGSRTETTIVISTLVM